MSLPSKPLPVASPTPPVPAGSDSILPMPSEPPLSSNSILPAPPQPAAPAEPNWDEDLREFGDNRRTRQFIYDNVLRATTEMEPTSNQRFTLKLAGARYIDPEEFTRKQQKEALLTGATMARRIKGTWELYDNTTGQLVDRATKVIARVPFLTQRGTFINGGNEYTLTHQQRLKPGVYTRIKDNGEIESHANILPGKGISHRYMLDPEKGVFQIKIGQATMPLMPLLKTMGVVDSQLREAWGDKLFAANYKANDPAALKKLAARVLRKKRDGEEEDDEQTTTQKLREAFEKMEVDPYVTSRTLGRAHKGMTAEAILDTTKKLLAVSRGESKVDDRDHLAYQNFLGPEDLFTERIQRDHGRLRKQLLMKIALKGGTLKSMPSGALSPQIEHALLSSGLGQSLEEINPAEIFDKQSRITRLGEGGIPCFSSDTEVFTYFGWKLWSEVTVTDKLACNVNGTLEFHCPKALYSSYYCGPMYAASTKRIDYLVTPSHRCWISSSTSGTSYWTGWRFSRAADMHGKKVRHKTAIGAFTDGTSPTSFTILPAPVEKSNRGTAVSTPVVVDFLAWVQFLGIYLADGSFTYSPTRKEYRVEIGKVRSQNPQEYDFIVAVLDQLPFTWRYEQGRRFVISGQHLAFYVRQFGKSADKFVPDYIMHGDQQTRQAFFTALTTCDNSGSTSHSIRYASASLQLRDQIAHLAITLGKSPTYYVRRKNQEKLQYGVLLKTASEIMVCRQHGTDPYSICDYVGKVYCATVPGELLLVRRNGKVHWSGNSLDAVPEESRSVQPSHMGYVDPLRTPESFRVGVDVHMARGARKGRDGKIYTQLRDVKSGKMVWKSPDAIADMAVAFPRVLQQPAAVTPGMEASYRAAMRRMQAGKPAPQDEELVRAYQKATARPSKRVPVMKGGEIVYVPRDEVDFELPAFENAFSPLGNLVPIKSMVKGQRVAMASRMLTQALPLKYAEAPLVQGAMPGTTRSFEEEYGKQMGAVRADKDGQVLSIQDGMVKVRFADGSTDDIELYENFPFNRKTSIHQTPMIKPGDRFKAGQLLVKSNYTDDSGSAALGLNARVAYVPYKGYNFEDATVISESMAQRMSSEHLYHHEVETDERTRTGKKAYASIFPGRFDKATLTQLDDDGVIKVGSEVEYGQPLILAAREKDRAQNKIHKKRQAGFNDVSVLWKHHDRGIVTDVVRGKKGPVVLVKSYNATQVGDKMSGRFGDKGVIAAIVPDHLMPHDRDGKPYEVLLNPLGIVSRTNPSQKVEAMLGKIARLTGKPVSVKDFDDIDDMTEWAIGELKKHGLSDLDDIVDPETNRIIPQVATGDRFFMKLHHTAEGKSQGRGSGGYTMEDTPSKGGETGCFAAETLVRSPTGDIAIGTLVRDRRAATVHAWQEQPQLGEVTDHFAYCVAPSELIEIELANGKVVVATRNHQFYLASGKKVLAGALVPGDDLLEG